MATPESVIQKINLLIEDANDATGSLHSNLRDAVDSLILGYGNVEVDSLSNLHAWSKYTIGGTIIEEPVTDILLFYKLASSSTKFELDYADSYEIVDNAISLVNPTTITLGSDNESRNAIKGKYVKRGNVYYIPTDARVTYGNYTNSKTIEVDKATKITYIASDSEFVGIVVSEDINAYPQNGEQDGYKYVYNGTLGAAGGTTLPTLTNPGTAGDLTIGKQMIDGNGNIVTGTVPVKDIVAQTNVESVMFDRQNGKISVVGKLGEKAIVSGTASIFTNVPANNFGDATAADVAAGKTFTSAAGVKVTGTHKCTGGDFIVTDDGAGNVTITSSAITDNNGNVVIA